MANINATRVVEIVKDCLFSDEEIVDGKPDGEFIEVRGLMGGFGFHPGRIDQHRKEINDMLDQLPDSFSKSKGGGMSFLNMCVDKDDNQWGEHIHMDHLVCLGIAIGRAEYLGREMASMLPGGMPYVSIGERGPFVEQENIRGPL